MPLIAATLTAGCDGGGDNPGDGGNQNNPPLAVAQCSTTPQSEQFVGFLQASDSDNSANELTFSLDPNVPRIAGPVSTAKGMVELLDVTTGEFRYTPNGVGPRGPDSFEFRVDDPESFGTADETVILNPAIMPLGDSITGGILSDTEPPEAVRVGYRRKLFDDLTARGFVLDFVGGEQGGQSANPPIGDPDHEGHSSFTAAQIADNVQFFLGLNPADAVLLHIGTNNINVGDPTLTAMDVERILNEIDQWEADNNTPVTVFLALIIDRSNEDGSFPNSKVDAYNLALRNMVAGRPNDDIVVVNQHGALTYPADMTPQNGQFIHPDEGGYAKMADTWATRIVTSGAVPRCN